MKLASAVLATFLATTHLLGCSSSSDGGGSQPISGTVLGTPFTPVGATALLSPPADCDTGAVLSLTGLVLGFTSFADACGFATSTDLCGDKASALIVPVIVLRAREASSGPIPPLGAGTYVYAANPMPDGNGILSQVTADVIRTLDAICTHPAEPDLTSGTVSLDVVSATRVAGSADLVFSDGSRFGGTFDVPVCAYQADVCGLVNGACPTPSCVP